MPVVPHYPSDEPDDEETAPDVDELIDDILDGGDPMPTAPISTARCVRS